LYGKALHVKFVNHAFMPRGARRLIGSPGKSRIDNHRLEHPRSAIAAIKREIRQTVPDAVAEMRVAPLEVADNLLGIRIQQELMAIEAKALLRIVRSVDAIAIHQPRPCLRQVAMPHLICLFADVDPMQFAVAGWVKNA